VAKGAGAGDKSDMIEIKKQKQSDFWWLTSEEAMKYKYIYVCYQEPHSDEPHSDKDPKSANRYFSLDVNNSLSSVTKRYPLEFIYFWKNTNNNINVFRSPGLFSDEQNGEGLLGPFLIDIDRQDKTDKGFVQDLNKALKDTLHVIKTCLSSIKENDYRIFFTGHKGFNIEINPHALGIISSENQIRQFRDIRKDINNNLGENYIDNIHDMIRLHSSINRWVANNGKVMNRMKLELSIHELNTMTIEKICEKSEKLAFEYLSEVEVV
jgi:hypothetical protein